ncbi:MAG: amino acid adenylation domain-containing protein [Pirellula sp.]
MTPEHPDWHLVLEEWNATETDYPSDKCIHELFEEQVDRSPDAIALVFEDQQITYRELNARANRLAHRLREMGVVLEQLVAICMERSMEMVVGLLGILKSGGAYVPIDPSYPSERLAHMLSDSAADIVLTQSHWEKRLLFGNAAVLCLDREFASGGMTPFAETNLDAATIGLRSRNLAYVIYTSGSTGQPKGAMNEHHAVVNRLVWGQQTYHIDSSDRVLQKTPFSFDVSVWEFFWPLLTGACLVVARPEGHKDTAYLSQLIFDNAITTLHFVPSMLQVFVEEPRLESCCQGVRRVLCSGEALPYALTQQFFQRLSHVELHNLYGPTECAVEVTAWQCLQNDPTCQVPMGRPINNTRMYVLDSNGQPCPIGVEGELFIGGVQVGRGYWNRPELTAERFVRDPWSPKANARMYKTGDLCRWRDDGNLEYLGRLDDQVKLRGFRIELGEIESAINEYERVARSVVILREDRPNDKRLVAYCVPKSDKSFDLSELRAQLGKRLPDYMQPSAFVILETLPVSPNGKLDRKRLPAPDDSRADLDTDFVAPATPIENQIASIWTAVLGIQKVGIHDNFFRLGGNSLSAVRVLIRLNRQWQSHLIPRDLFDAPTISGLSGKIAESQSVGEVIFNSEESRESRIQRVERSKPLPLSSGQEGMWFLNQSMANRVAYNVPMLVRLSGVCDAEALQASLHDVLQRHESLRTRYSMVGGTLVQTIDPALAIKIPVEDLSNWDPQQRALHLAKWSQSDASTPFDLTNNQPVRAKIFVLGPEWHEVFLNIHHIACDGWSINLLIKEWESSYRRRSQGMPPDLPPLTLDFADYAVHQRQSVANGSLDKGLQYWRDQLRDMAGPIAWPGIRARTTASYGKGETLSFELNESFVQSLYTYCESRGITPTMVLLAAHQILVARYAGQSDIVTGIPFAGRTLSELEGIVGLFVNTLPIRSIVQLDNSLHDVVVQIRDVLLGAIMHQEVPFDKIVAAVQPKRSGSNTPLIQTMFVFQNAHDLQHRWGEIDISIDPVPTGAAKIDLLLNLHEDGGKIQGQLEFATDLFTTDDASRIIEHYQAIALALFENSEKRIVEIDMLSSLERQQVLFEWNATGTQYPRDKCVHELFEEHAIRTPDAIALEQIDRTVSYSELNLRSNQIAHWLIEHGVRAGDLVGLSLERSPEMIMAMIGILKVGAAYVPLDPKYPESRTRFMVEDAKLQVLIIDERSRDRLPIKVQTVLCLDRDAGALEQYGTENPNIELSADALAYVMYTSGSTGTPKGVEIPHRGVVRLVVGTDYVQFDATRVFLQLSTISFDAATFEVWGALLWGAKLVLAPPDLPDFAHLKRLLKHHGITTLWLTTTLFNEIVEHDPLILSRLKELLIGGEALSIKHVEMARTALGHQVQLINGYGPTESTTFTCYYRIPRQGKLTGSSIPIGKPIANTHVYVLDERLQPVPIGIPGELYIGGDGLARGYLNRGELTVERFVSNPFLSQTDEQAHKSSVRLYRTGDRCRWLPDGNLEFLGRIDGQIKLRGFRIETGEIESILQSHPDVLRAAVMLREDRPGEKLLVGYCTLKPGASSDTDVLQDHLETRLPSYMIPAAIIILESFPCTSNGKLDRAALPEPTFDRESRESDAPTTELEKQIAAIWSDVLSIPDIGIHDNFFELGGNSLSAMRAFAKMSLLIGNAISPSILFQYGTIAELIGFTQSKQDSSAIADAIPLQPMGTGSPLFVMPQLDGELFQMGSALLGLGEDFPVIGIPIHYRLATVEYLKDVRRIARDATEAICKSDSKGPYSLVGYSYGGFLAFEVACQLIARGKQVAHVIVIDTGPGPLGGKQVWLQWVLLIPHLFRQFPNWLRSGHLRRRLVGLGGEIQKRWRRLREYLKRGNRNPMNSDNVACRDKDLNCQLDFLGIALSAIRSYEPGYFPGTLTLIRAKYRSLRGDYSRDLGWSSFVQQLRVIDIDGDHKNILKPPRIELLTDQIKQLMKDRNTVV